MLAIVAAMRPATGEDVALVLPEVSTVAMAIFLEDFAGARPAHVHGVMALERAGWHGSKKLTVPNNVSLAPPPYSPELNPAERRSRPPVGRVRRPRQWPGASRRR